MRKLVLGLLAALTLALSLALPACADLYVEKLLVRRKGDNANVRVTLFNPSTKRQQGPIVVILYARKSDGDDWTKLKQWNDINYLQSGNKVSRDYFDANNQFLHDLVASGTFDVKVKVQAPGLDAEVESRTHYPDPGSNDSP